MTIRGRVLFVLTAVIAVVSALYAYILYATQKAEYLDGIDRKLVAGATMARTLLGEDFHDRVTGKDSVSPDAYLAMIDRYNRVCLEAGFQYLWSNLFLDDGTIVFTSSTSASKDVEKGDHALFFDAHSDPSAFQAVLRSRTTTFSTFRNEWGAGRMVLVPYKDAQGRIYVFGASISIGELEGRLRDTALRALGVFVVFLIAGVVVSTGVAAALARPLGELTRTAEGIASGRYGLHVGDVGGGKELTSLADSVNAMSDSIRENHETQQTMVRQLEETRDELRRSRDQLEDRVVERTRAVRRLTQAIEQSPHAVFITDLDGTIEYVNPRFTEMTGYTSEEAVGKNPRFLQSGDMPDSLYRDMWQALLEDGCWEGELKDRRKDGRVFWASTTLSQLTDDEGRATHYVAFHQNITERKLAEEEIHRAREQAEAASQAKSDFLSSMSHELRTPLNAILGFSQLLEMDPDVPPTPTQSEALSHIRESGAHLLTLIDQVLDLAKVESGRLTLSIEDVDPHPVIDACRVMAELLGRKKNIAIEDRTQGKALPHVIADVTRFKQVLLNFLSNAIKYNVEGGSVVLDADVVPGRYLRFLVTDTGEGIPEARRAELFRPFNRLGREGGEVQGTGIGLSISRELIHRMGGNLGFDSEPGTGTTFWFELRTSASAGFAKAEDVADVRETGMDFDIGLADGETRTVLYVEDNPANLELMKRIMRRISGVRIVTAETAEDGIARARAVSPDLILMDINLPDMDGKDALLRLRTDGATADIPVIAVSALAMKGDVARGLQAGFDEYVSKPVRVDGIIDVVRRWIGDGRGASSAE